MGMEMLDLLLVNPGERELIYQGLGNDLTAIEPPLWCRLIAGYVRDRGHSVAILDAAAAHLRSAQIADEVTCLQPRLVGLIVFGHQPSASTQQMVGASAAAAAIKARLPEQKIIIVGGHVAALPELTILKEAVDYACNSEGPVTVERLVAALKTDTADLATIPGLVYREGEEARSIPAPALIRDLDADLHGNCWDLLPMERYRAHNWQCFDDLSQRQPYASIYTSLGCPYQCTFCCINAPFGVNRYRMRSPDAVAQEVFALHDRYGIKTFKIIDEMFVLNDRHVHAICDRLIERDLDLNFWAYARVDTVKGDMLAKLRKAGIRWLALGIESGSEHVRDGADKSFDQSEIIDIVRQIQAAGIYVIGNFIFGLPDDDLKSMQQTLDLAIDLNCEFANFYSAMAYPGAPLYSIAVEKGWALPENWSGFSQHSYDSQPLPTDHIPAAEVLRFRDNAFHRYFENPRYLQMVAQRFGTTTGAHVAEMSRHRLRRRLLEPAGTSRAG
jgi:anaerobic magnesium-protoporphyrin IX monomethyl ester cyclase